MKITLLGTGTPAPSLERRSRGIRVATQGIAGRAKRSWNDHCMDYARLVLQRWDMGANRIPDLKVYGPQPIARMTELLFGEEGVFGPGIRARVEHQSSIDVFEARGGKVPRKRPAPEVREVRAGDTVAGSTWKVTVGHAAHWRKARFR